MIYCKKQFATIANCKKKLYNKFNCKYCNLK